MAAPTMASARFGMIIGAILCLTQCQHPEKSVASAGTEKVILIGWDGADWRIARDLIARGEMPHLATLVAEGASAELETLRPTVSPMIWTSIATGVSPVVHGIHGFWTEATADDRGAPEHITDQLEALGYIDAAQPSMRLYESTDRRFDALWNRVEATGLRASIIGWWITYPAERLSGGMVSERFFLNRVQLDLETGGSTVAEEAGLVYPQDELSALDALRVVPRDITPERLSQFISVVAAEDDASLETQSSVEQLRMVIAKDEMTSRVAARFLERDAELVAVYFHGACLRRGTCRSGRSPPRR